MKKLLFILAILAATISFGVAQTISYQAVIRDNTQRLVTNTNVNIQVDIREVGNTAPFLSLPYNNVPTNLHGLVSVDISNPAFTTINWSKCEMSVSIVNSANTTIIYMPANYKPVNAVPYAFYAEDMNRGTLNNAITDYVDTSNHFKLVLKNYLTANHYLDSTAIVGHIHDSLVNVKADIAANTADIAANTADIATNATAIGTNATNIATNATNIAANTANIATNATNIAANTADIATNATNIATNTADIATNATNIAANATNIAANTADIATNATAIGTNATNIATNATNIAANTADIATNTTNIAANTADIATNATNIAANATNIATNATAIGTNATNIAANTADIATNATAIGTNATNIAANTADIATNATAIGTNATNITNLTTKVADSVSVLRDSIRVLRAAINKLNNVTMTSKKYTATAAQTAFTVDNTPASNRLVQLYINGVYVGDSQDQCVTFSTTTITYDPSKNSNYSLKAGDRIQIVYWY